MTSNTLKPESLLAFKIPSGLSVSGDGGAVCFETRCSEINLYLKNGKSMTTVGHGVNPSLSPSGKFIAWVENADDGELFSIYSVADGKIRRTKLCDGIREIVWADDENSVIATGKIPRRERAGYPELRTARLVDRLKFKADNQSEDGIWDGTYRQLLKIEIEPQISVSQMTFGDRDCKNPFWVDADTVGYVANDNPAPDMPEQFDRDSLFLMSLNDGVSKKLCSIGGPIESAAVSPDKQEIAFIGHDYRFFEATVYSLFIVSVSGGDAKNLNSSGFSCNNHVFSDAGLVNGKPGPCWVSNDEIACVMTKGGASGIFLFRKGADCVKEISFKQRAVYSLVSDKKGGLYFIFSSPTTPAAISEINGGEESKIWATGEGYDYAYPQAFLAGEVESWIINPRSGVEPKGVILAVHGGPHICFGYSFAIDFQMYAAAGYAVVYSNPAGSQGYGQSFCAASKHDWGGRDFRDILGVVDFAKRNLVGPDIKWAITGISYGGFMTNWAVGHSKLFQCAISERGTSNRYSQSGTSDCAYRYGIFEFDGLPWKNPDFYISHSPISFVSDITTPLLLMHGESDMNCHITQSEELYMALKIMGRDVVFARFPKASHDFAAIGDPKSRLDRYDIILWWLEKYMPKR